MLRVVTQSHAGSKRLRDRRAAWAAGGLCALALVAFTTQASAATYKWTDANGHVVYSDQPPPGDIKSELIGPAPPVANPNAIKEMAQKDADLRKRQQDRVGAEVKAEKDKQQNTQRRDLCLVVRGKLKDMRAGMPVYKYDDKGARVILDATARATEMEKQTENEKKFCGASTA